jgi:hypothetical protein
LGITGVVLTTLFEPFLPTLHIPGLVGAVIPIIFGTAELIDAKYFNPAINQPPPGFGPLPVRLAVLILKNLEKTNQILRTSTSAEITNFLNSIIQTGPSKIAVVYDYCRFSSLYTTQYQLYQSHVSKNLCPYIVERQQDQQEIQDKISQYE